MPCLPLLSARGQMTPMPSVEAGGLQIGTEVVDPRIFHLPTWQTGNPLPPVSPFVVETSSIPGSSVVKSATNSLQARVGDATLDVESNGHFRLRDAVGKTLVTDGIFNDTHGKIVLTLAHDPRERFYGAGNEGRNRSGDLTHPSGTQTVDNGVTRVPFLWSTGGWSLFVANNQNGTVWKDENGVLTVTVHGPFVDLYLGTGENGYQLLDDYSRLTGRAPIPPKWAFGYLQSRWGYGGAGDVQDKWHQFRDRQIPVDAFIYDYDWFQNDWDFNPNNFPTGSLDKMKELGLRFVGIRKPRVNDGNLDYARMQGWVLSSPLGTDLRFDLPVARYWWWSHQLPLVQAGVAGWWNDEAEQTVDEFFQMTQAEWDGWRAAKSDERAWEINRAFAPGIQRFGAATWTGDISCKWETLANQPGTLLNWSLAGMPFVSNDLGGFEGTPTPEMYARWIESGVFEPVMRAHGTFGSPRWPWAFGEDVLAATKKAIELRYRLIPYLYSLAAETHAIGTPMMRPLLLEFPEDEKTFNLRDEWLVGSRLLAAPVLTQGGMRRIYLPKGGWYDFNTGARVAGGQVLGVQAPLDVIPAYVRAGTVLPLGPVLQSTSLGTEDPLEVRIYPGADGDFRLYEDDGETYGYEKGALTLIPFYWDDTRRTLIVGNRAGKFPNMLPTRHLEVVLPDGTRKSVVYEGKKAEVLF